MKWKTFDQLFPSMSGCDIIVRHKTEKGVIFLSEVQHPYSVNPKKYNKDFFKIFMGDEWIDVCSDLDDIFEWLDPYEDKKEKEKEQK